MDLVNNNILSKNFGAVFLGPDTFWQGEVPTIMNLLKDKGFSILKKRIKRKFTNDEIENLFFPIDEPSLKNCEKYKWWMVRKTFDLGPMMCLIVYKDKVKEGYTCSTELKELKGEGDPFLAKKGTIRSDLKSINYSMNLIHTTDDAKCLLKDTRAFYSLEEIEEMVTNIKCQDGEYNYKLDKYDMLDIDLCGSYGKRDYSFFKAIYTLKFLLINSFAENNERIMKLKDIYYEYLQHVENNDRWTNLNELKSNNILEYGILQELINKDDIYSLDYRKLKILLKLADDKNYPDITEAMFYDIESLKIYLDDINRHILITSFSQWREY